MLIGNKISYAAATEAYCLLTAYIREEKVAATYKKEDLQEFASFLSEIIKHPENFVNGDVKNSLKASDHPGLA